MKRNFKEAYQILFQIRKICLKDFVEGAEVVRPTVIEQELTAYKEWDKKFGCLR